MPQTYRRRARNERAQSRRTMRDSMFRRMGQLDIKQFPPGKSYLHLSSGEKWRLAWSADEAATRFSRIGPTDIWMVSLANEGTFGYVMAHQVVGFTASP